jgi:hypothetical protein
MKMDQPTTYTELKAMIEREWQVKSLHEIVQLLERLKSNGQLETGERDSLLELYIAKHSQSD